MAAKKHLVVARTNLDEIPIGLCNSIAEATRIAGEVTEKQAWDIARDVMGVDNAGLVCVAIITFVAGKPVGMVISHEFDNGKLTKLAEARVVSAA